MKKELMSVCRGCVCECADMGMYDGPERAPVNWESNTCLLLCRGEWIQTHPGLFEFSLFEHIT